jgi:phosphate transport system substrate-binding protein
MTAMIRRTVRRLLRVLVPVGASLVLALGGTTAANAATHALIQGSGSSWAANAINQWVADVAAQGMKVVFTANGAAQGRKDYANRANQFAVSDIGYRGADPTTGTLDSPKGRSYAYLPIAAGGTAFPYHVEVGGKLVRNLRLRGETIAKIFTSQITNWNDPAITRDNNGTALPSIPIIPVVHAEGAGVTNQFTRYLSKEYPAIWKVCNGGKVAETEYFPLNCGKSTGNQKALSGSDGVMSFLKSKGANGSIGIEEYSYPLLANYPAAKVLNAAGYYTLPTQYNVAVALTKAVINDEAHGYDPSDGDYLLQKLDNVYTNADRRTYPLSSYVYAIIPTSADDEKLTSTAERQTLADFLYFSICQGQAEIGPIGYSSLPVNLVNGGFTQIAKIKAADPKVDLDERDVSTCHNPTFIAGKPNQNYLATIAPNPPSCDKEGAGPCAAGVGGYNGANPSDTKNASGGKTTAPSAGATGGAAAPTAPGSAGPVATEPSAAPVGELGVDSGSTELTSAAGAGAVVPTTLPAQQSSGPRITLSILVGLLLLLAIGLPGVLSRGLGKRGAR